MNLFARATIVLFCISLASTTALASPDAGAPEYIGVIAARDPGTGKYQQLERAMPQQGTKVRAFGFGGARTFLDYPGESSPVRFKAGQPLEFVIRVDRQDRDPANYIQFWSLIPGNGIRTLPLASGSMFGASTNDMTAHAVQFNAEKFGPNFFKFRTNQPLPPGEYSISTSDDKDGFNFGIDP